MIKLIVNFSPGTKCKINEIIECYFDTKPEMIKFLDKLNKISKKRYEYEWEEVSHEIFN